MKISALLELAPKMDLKAKIRDVSDFPRKGVIFRDLTTLWKDHDAFIYVVDELVDRYKDERVDVVAGIEARGFIVAAPLAYRLKAGFVPLRKPGRLPSEKVGAKYELEYGSEGLELHVDAVRQGQRVLVVDDLLATGGTALAAAQLIERLGGEVVGMAFIVELAFLNGRKKLEKYDVQSLASYETE